jgi:secreted PhoX family phosphatase
MKTAYSVDGTQGRGSLNNCANGFTPWSTYLTCEENWVGYFRRDASDVTDRATLAPKQQTSLARYGKGTANGGNFSWTTASAPAGDTSVAKFNITLDPAKPADGTGDFRNEIFQFGWVIEIDPYDPAQTPRKRTALGRMNHEGAWPGRFVDGRKPAWYMGDDAANEYLYKFVSNTPWAPADAGAADRLAVGDKYLDAGTLYVARFAADGSGQWLPLVYGQGPLTAANAAYPFADQADVLANARLAGDALGATKMDRPEWTAVNPATGEIYLTCTQNTTRTPATTDAANPRAYTDPKTTSGATSGNANGHIIRLRETGDTTEATAFAWDIYVFGAGKDLDPANINLSGLTDDNDFSMCDGLWFGRPSNAMGLVKPLLWIETDDSAYTDVTNCMLLCAQPGTVGDGASKTITNTIAAATGTQTTRVGAAPGTNLRRFLVGPKECEITGIDTTPDGKTLFVNIQHPGENGNPANITSHWPDSQTSAASIARPRSATIAITKNDGGVVGL